MIRSNLCAALAAALLLSLAGSAGAAVDPERNASTPTSWHWWRGQSAAKLDKLVNDAGERVISINADDSLGTSFSAATVHNDGPYARDGDWFAGKTRDEVVALTKGKNRRLIDLEPYDLLGQTRFAGVTVPNTGESAKGWWWNYDLSADQVKKDIDKHGIRLVDLDVYKRFGKRRFAYVGIKNTGEDARAWWWYYNVTPQFVQDKATELGARLVSIDRHQSGRLTVVMVHNDEHVFTRHAYNVTQGWLNKYVQSQGVRITDLQRYGNRYYATMIDNVDAETGRIRGLLLDSRYNTGYFGAYAQAVKGQTYVGLAHQAPYQPMSVLKLVPHLYVMDKLDQDPDLSLLDDKNAITWKYIQGQVKNPWCSAADGALETKVTTLRDTLTQGLGISLNTAHEALLNTYKPDAITNRIHQLGLNNTQLYYGCKYDGLKDWTSNRTTLTEMGQLFAGVDTKAFFPNHWKAVRDEFYGLMATWPSSWLKPVVADEAAKAGKPGVVDDFMKLVEVKGKGGGVDNTDADGNWVVGRSFSYHVTLPFKASFRGLPVTLKRNFVGGFFVNDMQGVCGEDAAKQNWDAASPACQSYVTAIDDTFSSLTGELQRTAIREALKTW
jgi:hypothetical protein